MIEIPPYQAIDIVLGTHLTDRKPPIAGFYVHGPEGYGKFAYTKDQANELAATLETKYSTSILMVWIHEAIDGRIYHTPR